MMQVVLHLPPPRPLDCKCPNCNPVARVHIARAGLWLRRYPNCSRIFRGAGALHTHQGWHKRKENIEAGVYDRLEDLPKVRLTIAST